MPLETHFQPHEFFEPTNIVELANELASQLKLDVRSSLDKSFKHDPAITQKILEHTKDRELDLPRVETYTTVSDIQKVLVDVGYDRNATKILPNEALLLIRLPEQLNKFYDKHTSNDGVVSWGKHYDNCINQLWDTARQFAYDNNLTLERINPTGFHEKEYYYLWHLSPNYHLIRR